MDFYDVLLAEKLNGGGGGGSLTRLQRFGAFAKGISLGKNAGSSVAGYPKNAVICNSASARAAMVAPIPNDGYVFTVTDSAKYSLAIYDVQDNTPTDTTYQNAIFKTYYMCSSKAVSWASSDSVTTDYVMIALKKNDNTDFTAAELDNGAEAVFTFTTN